MTFAHPFYLIAGMILLPAYLVFLVWVAWQRRRAISRLGAPAFIHYLSANLNQRGRFWQALLWLLACAAVLVALARPQWGEDVLAVEKKGAQIMVVLDVSPSMLATDETPNRLARAKATISDLIAHLQSDEVGLVLFSGASFTVVPLTTDHDIVLNALASADVSSISRKGTVIGDAIRTAAHSFNDELPNQKAIILFTDGEDTETDPLTAAEMAAKRGILIYAIGLGSATGAPIPVYDDQGNLSGFKEDDQGNVIQSALNESALQAIAAAGQGRYLHSTDGKREVRLLLQELDDLQRTELETYVDTQQLERFPLFLVAALLSLVLFELIPERKADMSWQQHLLSRRQRRYREREGARTPESDLGRASAS